MKVKQFKHVGTLPITVADRLVYPGETFSAILPEEQEVFYRLIGAIEEIPAPRKVKSEEVSDGETNP